MTAKRSRGIGFRGCLGAVPGGTAHDGEELLGLTNDSIVEKQMQVKLDECDFLPEDQMEKVRKLWANSIMPAQTKLQALCVFFDPRILEKLHSDDLTLDKVVIERPKPLEAAYDLMVHHLDYELKYKVNKSWLALCRSLLKGESSIVTSSVTSKSSSVPRSSDLVAG